MALMFALRFELFPLRIDLSICANNVGLHFSMEFIVIKLNHSPSLNRTSKMSKYVSGHGQASNRLIASNSGMQHIACHGLQAPIPIILHEARTWSMVRSIHRRA